MNLISEDSSSCICLLTIPILHRYFCWDPHAAYKNLVKLQEPSRLKFKLPNVAAEGEALLLCIQGIMGSNLGPETRYPD
jgi:hypothetical protein